MKDSSVAPAGLFGTRRQRRLLDGLAERFESCLAQQAILRKQHDLQRTSEEQDYGQQRAVQTADCREQRRSMLREWDDAEEDLISLYERTAIENRMELNRLGTVFRRRAAEEKKAIDEKVEQRQQAIHQEYEACKNQPGLQKRKQIKRLDESLAPLHQELEQARELVVRRLDGLPEIPPAEADDPELQYEAPKSLDDAVATVGELSKRCTAVIEELHSGTASKVVDSFVLPIGGVVFAMLWAVVAYFVAPQPPWLWMIAGVIPAGVIGFVVMLALLLPLKRMTTRLYPRVERLGQTAEQCANDGRKIAARTASDAAAELVQRRDSQIQAAEQWKGEQLTSLATRLKTEQEELRKKLQGSLVQADEAYSRDFVRVGSEMREKANSLVHQITGQLAETDQQIVERRDSLAKDRYAQMEHLSNRLKAGVGAGLHRISTSADEVNKRFPDWATVLENPSDSGVPLDFVPVGWLQVGDSLANMLRPESDSATGNGAIREEIPEMLGDGEIPSQIPVVLHRRLHSGLVIQASGAHLERAIELAHQVLWRLLTGAPPSLSKLTLVDPLGRGQHFTSFMALADHDPSIVGHRVWTTDAKIDARLGELAHHVEDVLQASLRDRFERIEDYNEVAGSMAEPYRAVAAVGFPEGLSRDGYRHLRALLESGLRCGIFTVLVCDKSKPWPTDIPIPSGDKILQVEINDQGDWHLMNEGLERLPFVPASLPANSIRTALVEKIGQAAVAASRVEIPLEQILQTEQDGQGSTDDEVQIVIGSQGANRSLCLQLGEGVRQHVLIAGKTGSGKSTLLHSIITSGAHHYTPDELQFYLLDFKKGVEFKLYADSGLPHARVVGIESEREFGRSVLQRLDEELQQRGERFRAASVQELGDYREATGEAMPRIMLVVDEFQELFVRDDRLAGDCTMLLDRLVRQGRSFGMHVVLSSQSLAGAYSLPRATLGQMAVRIAMQCSEADAALILSDDNTAARLISRPGEAIYNDAGGLVEGNQPFQVAWLSSNKHRELIGRLAARDQEYTDRLPPPVIFEGNRPCRWTPALANAAAQSSSKGGLSGLLGESVEIGPPLAIELVRDTGRNVLLITSSESRGAILASLVAGIKKSDPRSELIYFDGTRADDGQSLSPWLTEADIEFKQVKVRDCESEMARLAELIQQRGDQDADVAPVIAIIDPLERFRDLRQDESFNFSLDAPAGAANGSTSLQTVMRDGPQANVFVVLVCGSVETMSRWLPRASQHDLELRIIGQMNASDSALLIDSPVASDLSAATMLLYDDSDGRIAKFRQCDLPDPKAVGQWLR